MRRSLLALAVLFAAATPAAAVGNPIQLENARPGTPGWEVPADGGTLITGYASQTSAAPGQHVDLRVSAPTGTRYRVVLYRLGWYRGVGGRLIKCVPGCSTSRAAVQQPPPTRPDPRSGLYHAPWSVTDRVIIPPDAVSGYYEARLVIVSGPGAGAVGMVPLIVRARQPESTVLVQVPVNTWQAYNPWGGKSLYGQTSNGTHATVVSFDRPYDMTEFSGMQIRLELPWVRFLEANGVDVSYQTDDDTDRDPQSLIQHRLVFAIGHDEYWTQTMRDAFDRARSEGTNLMFGSNSDLWRVRYAAGSGRRTLVEWRNPYADPARSWKRKTGFFRQFGEPECQLMAVEYQEFAQRGLNQPPTSYTVVGSASDPWLSAAGLKPGDVVQGVMGYEWDSLSPGCFHGKVVSLMHAVYPGSDGIDRSADMVRATSPSGARVFSMGTMELPFVIDPSAASGEQTNLQVVAFVKAGLADLQRPAAPARLIAHHNAGNLVLVARLRAADPRIVRVSVRPVAGGRGCADALHHTCRVGMPGRPASYAAVAVDAWGRSQPLVVKIRPG